MGGDDDLDGVANFDEIEGLDRAVFVMGLDDDEMGLAPLVLYPLIALGAVGLLAVLSKLYSAAFAGHPDPNQASPDQMDPNMVDPNAAAYPGQMDPSMMDPSMMDPNAAAAYPGQYPDASTYQDPYAASDSDYPPTDYYPQG